jgi:hypothetical protein
VTTSQSVDTSGISSNAGTTPTGWGGEINSATWFDGWTYALCAAG